MNQPRGGQVGVAYHRKRLTEAEAEVLIAVAGQKLTPAERLQRRGELCQRCVEGRCGRCSGWRLSNTPPYGREACQCPNARQHAANPVVLPPGPGL